MTDAEQKATAYATKHWDGDNWDASFDSFVAGYEAARREAEGMKLRDIAPNETVRATIDKMAGDGVVFVSDAPPPPDLDALRHKLLALRGNMRGAEFDNPNVGLVLRDAADAIEALRARAEAAKADAKRLREALNLAADRFAVLATHEELGVKQQFGLREWAKEARAAQGGK